MTDMSAVRIVPRQQQIDAAATSAIDKALDDVAAMQKSKQEERVKDSDPVVEFGEEAADKVMQSGHDVMAAAESHMAACKAFADELRRATKEVADQSRKVLERIRAAATHMHDGREQYHNGK